MKKILFASLVSFSTLASYADTPYAGEQEMSEDVSLLAQSSLLYKNNGEKRMYDNTKMLCLGIQGKYDLTKNRTENMIRWMGKVQSICSEYWSKKRWCCQLTDLVYDGVFEVLQWLLFLSAVPPVQLLTGWCVTAKAPPDISAISALTAVKHGNCSSLTPLLNPVRTRKSLIWPWMALDAGQPPALWALASTRFSAI